MKKFFYVVLAFFIAFVTIGCSKSSDGASSAGSGDGSYKTMADAFAVETRERGLTFGEDFCIYVFYDQEKPMRVVCKMTKELYDQAAAAMMEDEPGEIDKQAEILGPLEVIRTDDLSKDQVTQEELNQLVGKTGQDLLDDGYKPVDHNFDEETAFYLEKGYHRYRFVFNETVKDHEDFDHEKEIAGLTVKKASYDMLGSGASNLDELE